MPNDLHPTLALCVSIWCAAPRRLTAVRTLSSDCLTRLRGFY